MAKVYLALMVVYGSGIFVCALTGTVWVITGAELPGRIAIASMLAAYFASSGMTNYSSNEARRR